MKKSINRLLYFIGLCPLFIGCASLKPIDTSCVTYKSKNLDYSSVFSNKLGLLPVLAGEGWEGFRRQTGEEITIALKEKFKPEFIVDPIQTLNAINDNNLSNTYSELINTYDKTGIINKQILSSLGASLGCRFFLYSKVGQSTDYEEVMGVDGKTDYAKINQVHIAIQLWDVVNGDIVWEGYCGGAGLSDVQGSDLSSLISLAAKGLSERLGKSKEETPPCKNSKDLAKEQSKSNSIPYLIVGLGSIIAMIVILL